jgi:hypothetical protein
MLLNAGATVKPRGRADMDRQASTLITLVFHPSNNLDRS